MKNIKKKDKKGLTFEITKYIFAPHLEDDPNNLNIIITRRSGRVAESTGLLNRRTWKQVPRVRIPPPPPVL